MRIAYLDCFSGISGDMFMGALLDAGVSPKLLEDAVAALNVGARLEISKVKKGGLAATKADVWVAGEKDQPLEEYWAEREHKHEHGHDHSHSHSDSHEHSHAHKEEECSHHVSHHHDHVHGRGLKEIRQIISTAAISEAAKKIAIAIFESLGKAEAKVHDAELESVHFHEVGAVDAMVDIVCAAVGSEALGVDEWVCSPLNVGGGTVKCAHGILPVPPPAVVELLKGIPTYSSGIQKELVTPTGAAIVKTLASRFGAFPAMTVGTSAYGAGSRDLPTQPNVLRLVVGESTDLDRQDCLSYTPEMISVIEANLDDLNPQVFSYVMDRLFAAGALDVFGTPVQMKKGRPGMVLTVLARPEQASDVAKIIFAETTTIGVRMREERRQVLQRRSAAVQTQWGEVRMKIANLNGTITNYAPEYEDCRRIAEEKGVPLKSVMQEAIRLYLQNG